MMQVTVPVKQVLKWYHLLDDVYDYSVDVFCEYYGKPTCPCPGCDLRRKLKETHDTIRDLIANEIAKEIENNATDS